MVKKILFLSILATVLPALIYAQASVSGFVLNSKTGQPLPGATVKLDDGALASGKKGEFLFSNIETGSHQLVVSYVGFSTYKKKSKYK